MNKEAGSIKRSGVGKFAIRLLSYLFRIAAIFFCVILILIVITFLVDMQKGITFQPVAFLGDLLLFMGWILIAEYVSRILNKKLCEKTRITSKTIVTDTYNTEASCSAFQQQGEHLSRVISSATKRIGNQRVRDDLCVIQSHVSDIFKIASQAETNLGKINKFGRIYIPKLIELADVYIELEGRAVETEEVRRSMENIANMIGDAKNAFAKLNDELTQYSGLYLDADIEAFADILRIDGLLQENVIEMIDEKVNIEG